MLGKKIALLQKSATKLWESIYC